MAAYTSTAGEAAFEPSWVVALPDGSAKSRTSWRYRTPALLLVLLLHLLLLRPWRTSALQEGPRAASISGGGGVELTLVARAPGALPDAAAATSDERDPNAAFKPAPSATAEPDPTSETPAEAPADATAQAASPAKPSASGGSGAGETGQGVKASAGEGYDPWARSSLAPASFSSASTPGLWEKVKACFKATLPPRPIVFDVIIDSAGQFVDASARPGASSQMPGPIYQKAVSQMDTALRACGPYADLKPDLSKRFPLTLPPAGAPQ